MRDPERAIRNGSAIASRPWSPGPDPGSRIPILKILSAEFVTSAAGAADFPVDGLPEVAMVGREGMAGLSAVFTVPPRTIRPGVRIAFVQAPDNVRIELLERT